MRPRLLPLASFELAWTDAAFDAIYPEPPRSRLPHGVVSMHPARFFDDVLASVPFEQSLGLRVTLWMVALAPLFTIRRLGTIASIAPEDRSRVLERLLTSPVYVVRQLAMSFKALATLLYAKSDSVRAAMQTPIRTEHRDAVDEPAYPSGLVSAARLTLRGRANASSSETGIENSEESDHAAA